MASVQRVSSIIAARVPTLAACVCLASAVTLPPSRCASEPDRRASMRRKRERDERRNPCEEFNSLKWRMSYASRKDDCNALDSCVFIGRSITGACAPRDPSLLHERSTANKLSNVPLVLPDKKGASKERKAVLRRQAPLQCGQQHTARVMSESIDELGTELQKKEDNTLTANRFRELMDTLDVDEGAQELALAILKEEGLQAVQAFVQGQLANAAAEELRYQKVATEAFAKDFLIQVLRNPELPSQMGRMLESVFKDPTLSTGVRHLIYNAVGLDYTFQSSLYLVQPLVTWLLTETNWMDDEAVKLCTYLIELKQTELAMIWICAWAIREPGMLDVVASRSLLETLPLASDQLTEAMISATVTTLESEWALEIAKATVIELMQEAVPGSKPPPSASDGPADNAAADSNVSKAVDEGNRHRGPDEPTGAKEENGASEIVVDVAETQGRDGMDGASGIVVDVAEKQGRDGTDDESGGR
ncbi:unnamed protein product [Laminaria digitata]